MTKESLTGGGIEIADLGRVVGLSAYELAVKQGYEGSLDEWLESLKYVSSEEYKELTKQVEVSAAVIEEALKKADTKVQEITNLSDQSLQAVNTAKAEAVNAVKNTQTSATGAVQQAQSTAEQSIETKKNESLQALAEALSEAETSVRETGQSWNTQIESAGALQIDAIGDAGAEVKTEIEQAKDNAIEDIEKSIVLVSGGTFENWNGGISDGDQ